MYARERNCDRNASYGHCDIVVRTAPSAPYWCGKVVIDRRGNQWGNVLVSWCGDDQNSLQKLGGKMIMFV